MAKNKKIAGLVKAYSYQVHWSDDDEAFVARCVELDVSAHSAKSDIEALKEVKVAAELALELEIESGRELPEPINTKKYSGKFVMRVPKEKHRELAMHAASQGVSLNTYLLSKI